MIINKNLKEYCDCNDQKENVWVKKDAIPEDKKYTWKNARDWENRPNAEVNPNPLEHSRYATQL